MQTASNDFLRWLDALCEKRIKEIITASDDLEIMGTAYYVSNDGDDNRDGLTPDTAWRTLDKVSSAVLLPGDGVLFRRGDLFRGSVAAKECISYGAWGAGDKPKFFGWDKDLADPSLWCEVDKKHHIWKMKEPILDVGALVLNHGQEYSVKLIPSYIDGCFVCRNDESKLFEMANEMVRDLDIYWHFDSILTTKPSRGKNFPIPDITPQSFGELYLRCDRGNPGEVFDSIEALARRSMFDVGMNANVRIDNLCIKYVGLHAISAGGKCSRGLHVTNCEIGWIGGTIQHYLGLDPNYPQGGRGTVTRFGNGIEIYGGCDDYEVSNCYVYQVYDAGMSHQIITNGNKHAMTNVIYRDNLVEKCVYSIEYFLEMNKGDTESYMDGIEICGNILRESGYGWGQQRHNTDTPAHIKGWNYTNKARNYTIHDNIFDRAAYRMLHLVAEEQESCPKMFGNTYVQYFGNMIGQYGGNAVKEPDIQVFDEWAEETITSVFGDKDAKVYVIR